MQREVGEEEIKLSAVITSVENTEEDGKSLTCYSTIF